MDRILKLAAAFLLLGFLSLPAITPYLPFFGPSGGPVETTNQTMWYFPVTLTNDTGNRTNYICPNDTTVFANVIYLIGCVTGHGGGGAVTNVTSVSNGTCVATLIGSRTNFNALSTVQTEQISVWRFATNVEVAASRWTAITAGPAGGVNILVVGITNTEATSITDGGAMAIRQQVNFAQDVGPSIASNIFPTPLHPLGASIVAMFVGTASAAASISSNANSQIVEVYETGYASPNNGAMVGFATNLPFARQTNVVTGNSPTASKLIEIQKKWQ